MEIPAPVKMTSRPSSQAVRTSEGMRTSPKSMRLVSGSVTSNASHGPLQALVLSLIAANEGAGGPPGVGEWHRNQFPDDDRAAKIGT